MFIFNQIIGEIPRSGVIYQQTINTNELCEQCSKDGPEFLFGKMGIRGSRYEPCFPAKGKLLSCQIKMNALFKNNDGIKRSKYDRNIHKAMITPVNIYQTNKMLFVLVQPKKARKLESADHL